MQLNIIFNYNMKIVVQRVSQAIVKIEDKIYSEIAKGLLVLVGFENTDGDSDIEWISKKILNLRIFNDENGIMNLSINDVAGDLLIVSQFTLHANTKKGNRPSYIEAAKPEIAIPLYEKFLEFLKQNFNNKIRTGKFGADMKVGLVNDGPVTIIIDSKNKG